MSFVNGEAPAPPAAGGRARRILVGLVGLGISAFFGYLALQKVSLDEVGHSLATADYWWLIPEMALVAVNMVLRAIRWRVLFDDPKSVTTIQSLEGLSIGFMLNNVLPGRAGELARVFAVRRTAGLSAFEIGATVIVERILDFFILALIGVAVWPWLPDASWTHVLPIVCLGIIVGFVALMLFMVLMRARGADLLERLLGALPLVTPERAHTTRLALVAGGVVLVRPRQLTAALVLGVAIWISSGLIFVTLMPAFGLDPWSAAPWLALVAASLAVAIPSAPATLGVWEAATQAALVAFGISASVGLSYGVVLHAVTIVPVVVMGAVASWAVAQTTPKAVVLPHDPEPASSASSSE
jgi:uncharacterized protein (TIRG00374 family)